MSDEYETDVAVYEAERNRAWHSWFAARGHISPTDEHTLIFDGGFRMAWELCRAQPAPQPAEQQPCPESIREGTPYDDPAFESLCREHEIWGTAAAAQCAVFWEGGKRAALDAHRKKGGEV